MEPTPNPDAIESHECTAGWLSPAGVSLETGIPTGVLQTMREKGEGPAWYKHGHRTIRYNKADVLAYMAATRVDPAADKTS